MYKQNSDKYGNKTKNSGGFNTSTLLKNSLSVIVLIEAVALPFTGFTWANFFYILLIVIAAICAIFFLTKAYAGSSQKSVQKRMPIYELREDTEFHEARPLKRNTSHKLIKLERRNLNWSIKDIDRDFSEDVHKTEQAVQTYDPQKEDLKKRYNPYRSPFEPINKPDIQEKKTEEAAAKSVSSDEEEPEMISENEIQADFEDLEAMFEFSDDGIFEENNTYNVQERQDMEHQIDVEEFVAASSEESIVQVEPDMDEDEFDAVSFNTGMDKEDRKVLKFDFKQKSMENRNQAKPIAVVREKNTEERKVDYQYEIPSLELLDQPPKIYSEEDWNSENEYTANKLVETLASFGVGARVLDVSKGPSVTRYELQPNAGVKVSKIVGLSDDIALNLAATGVRIEAPIPGKAAVGIEVPNKEVKPVFLRDVIESEEFQRHPSKLAFAVGKDVAGRTVVGDIAKMPHLLIAGATGSGKSVCINTLIASILYKASPSEVKLLMVDPKVVELGIYNGIPHLLIPVVTDPKKAAGALNWAVVEMTSRYKLFAENNVRDLKGYNSLMKNRGEDTLPQIVIIIDELADLMMVAPNDVEDCICRLAQMARAAGMHLVIATQRPSVDVITGVIKANIPSRISFAVSSQIDSRTILDVAGAEKLLGRGDMLYNPIGEPKPVRVQGGYISDKEVEAIVTDIKSCFQADYDQDILDRINSQAEPQQQSDANDDDELLSQVIEMVIEYGQASASLIQRKFKVGYSRAARILDQMEAWGVVSPADGSKPRQILVTKQEWDELNS